MLYSSEPDNDPLIPVGVDISPPTAFSDTTENQTISEQMFSKTDLAPKPEYLPSEETQRLSLVASLRLAASEQEKEREHELERREKERIENIKREEREREEREKVERKERERLEKEKQERERLKKEKDEIERKERKRLEREKEERKRMEKEREELKNKQREEREREEKERKQQRENTDGEEKKKEEIITMIEREEKRHEIPPGPSSVQNNQEVANSQSNDWPPLREAEMDDIAYDEKLQRDSEDSGCKSDPKLMHTVDSKTENNLVSTRLADTVHTATNKLDSRSDKPEDTVKKSLDKKGKSNVKSGAIPVWLREEEDEEVEYERGEEDLGSIWLAELYMGGEAG